MFSNKAIAIRDAQVQNFIQSVGLNLNSIISPEHFVKQHREWLLNSNFYVQKLDRFKHGYVTAGCTEAFNEVYKEPCFVLQGEYTYHRDTGMAFRTVGVVAGVTPESALNIPVLWPGVLFRRLRRIGGLFFDSFRLG